MPGKPFVGVDLGGTNIQVGVVSPDFKLLGEAKRKTKAEEKLEGVLTRIVSGVEEACESAGLTTAELGGLGIGAPGAVDPNRGVVLEAVNLRWDDVPLAELLGKKLKLPVFLENDVNVAVYGENKLGAGKNAKNLLGVVQAIAMQTASSNPQAFMESFSERLEGLAASQDLLVESQWHGIGRSTGRASDRASAAVNG